MGDSEANLFCLWLLVIFSTQLTVGLYFCLPLQPILSVFNAVSYSSNP